MAGFNLMKNIAGMQLLFAQRGSSSTEKPKCHELMETLVLMNDPGICTPAPNKQGMTTLGNLQDAILLDFSKADESTINKFLANFTKIYGTIVMDGNDQVTSLNLGNIAEFDVNPPSDAMFILIRNNPKLEKIDWNSKLKIINREVLILVYNNPQLQTNSLDPLRTALATDHGDIKSYIQSTESKECEFAYPLPMDLEPSKYIAPTAEFLKNCKTIKGDFILKDVNLTGLGPFQLSQDACLSLINVDLKDVTFGFSPAWGAKDCKDGTLSNLTNNPNLCGGSMTALKKYYKDMKEIPITLHTATCTMPCVTDNEEYIFCESTTAASTTAALSLTYAPSGLAVSPSANVNGTSSPADTPLPMTAIVAVSVAGGIVAAIVLTGVMVIVLWKKGIFRRKKDKKKTTNSLKQRKTKKSKEMSHSGSRTSTSTTGTTVSIDQKRTKKSTLAQTRRQRVAEIKQATIKAIEEDQKRVEDQDDTEQLAENIAFKPHLIFPGSFVFTEDGTISNNYKTLVNGLISKGICLMLDNFNKTDYAGTSDPKKQKAAPLKKIVGDPAEELYEKYPPLEIKFTAVPTADDNRAAEKLNGKMRYGKMATVDRTLIQVRGGGWINANLVEPLPLCKNGKKFICTQGPLDETVRDFWNMLVDKESNVIVMLCDFEENGKPKCAEYVKLEEGKILREKNCDDGVGYEVKCLKTSTLDKVVQHSELELTFNGKFERKVHHFYYNAWPDHNVPTIENGMKLFPMRDLIYSVANHAPIIVHCSAGIGRTGVFVLLNMIMDMLIEGLKVDYDEVFKHLRSQRGGAVQYAEQYPYAPALLVKKGCIDGLLKWTARAKKFVEAAPKLCITMQKSYKTRIEEAEKAKEDANKNAKKESEDEAKKKEEETKKKKNEEEKQEHKAKSEKKPPKSVAPQKPSRKSGKKHK